jgi:hypothetical protein
VCEQARRLHVDHELRAGMQPAEIAGEHHADLVGEDLGALVVHHAAAVPVAVEAEPTSAPCAFTASEMACSIFMSSGLGL